MRHVTRLLVLVSLLCPLPSWAVIHNVSTAGQLTTAMSAAVAGDEIVLANGTYSGTFTTNNAGTSGSKITLRAANKHQATLVGDNVCDRSHQGLILADAYWVIKDLKFTQHGRAITITANNTEVQHNLLEGYREEGIRVDGGDTNFLHHNVIGYSDSCSGTDSPAIFLVTDADGNIVQDNIVIATGNDGYMCGGVGGCNGGEKFGYGIFVANNSDNNLIQGNLLLANGGKGILRLLSDGANSASVTGTLVRDNAFLFGEGGSATDDCNDNLNSFINNLFYGSYFWQWYTKGQPTGSQTTGNHTFRHNTVIETVLSRGGIGYITASGGACNGGAITYKINNTLRDNVLYADAALSTNFDNRRLLTLGGSQSAILSTASHNLFWAPSAANTWVQSYTYQATDIHAGQPVFTNVAQGNFSLQTGSPGKAAASDGTDIGIAYNSFLKQTWLQQAFALPAQENLGLTAATSTSFAVNTARSYQVWFYIPNSPCSQANEQFTIEGATTDLVRDINGLVSTVNGVWLQAGGPQRYITLGRHRATDGTLNVSWQHTNCVERVFIRELPTAPEAYAWIAEAPATPPDITSNLEMRLRFEEGAGTVAEDATVNNHDGTLSGGATWGVGTLGSGAVALDGVNDAVTVTGELGTPASVSLAAWVKRSDVLTGGREVLSLGDHVAIRVSPSTIEGFYSSNATTWHTVSATATLDTNWHHLVLTVTAGTQRLYLDGVQISSTAFAPAISYSGLGTNTLVGTHGNGGTGKVFPGLIDDARVYTRVLSAVDVAALFALAETAPTLAITQPVTGTTYSIDTATLTTVAGTASDDVLVQQVTWSCDVCGAGIAQGTTSWSIPSITLQEGANMLTVTAVDETGLTATDTLTITYTPPAAPTSSRQIPALTLGGFAGQ